MTSSSHQKKLLSPGMNERKHYGRQQKPSYSLTAPKKGRTPKRFSRSFLLRSQVHPTGHPHRRPRHWHHKGRLIPHYLSYVRPRSHSCHAGSRTEKTPHLPLLLIAVFCFCKGLTYMLRSNQKTQEGWGNHTNIEDVIEKETKQTNERCRERIFIAA